MTARGLRSVYGRHAPGLCVMPGWIHYGQSSGYQAMNLAFHWGARRMLLLGFDCGVVNNMRHFFGDHPGRLNQTQPSPYSDWMKHFAKLATDLAARGVTVINCAPKSHLQCFKKSTVEQCLAPAA